MRSSSFLLIFLVFTVRDSIAQTPAPGQLIDQSKSVAYSAAIGHRDGSLLAIWPNEPLIQIGALSNETIRRALELSSEQERSIEAKSQENFDQMMNAVRKNSADPKRKPSDVIKREFSDRAATILEEILLPRQLERLKQIAFRIEISQRGLTEAISVGELSKAIGVNENQKRNLMVKGQAIESRIAEKIQDAQNEGIRDLLQELTPEQQTQAFELLGRYFIYENSTAAKSFLDAMRKRVKKFPTRREKTG